jgi:hypothetical protein
VVLPTSDVPLVRIRLCKQGRQLEMALTRGISVQISRGGNDRTAPARSEVSQKAGLDRGVPGRRIGPGRAVLLPLKSKGLLPQKQYSCTRLVANQTTRTTTVALTRVISPRTKVRMVMETVSQRQSGAKRSDRRMGRRSHCCGNAFVMGASTALEVRSLRWCKSFSSAAWYVQLSQ